MITERIKELSELYYEKMIQIRHKIHMNPELGYEEHGTSRLIASVLDTLNIDYSANIAGTGIVGLIKGTGDGRTVLLRADMDALAIQEEADVPYRSLIANRMHACGHDGHVAGLLGAAMILNDLRNQFHGNVKLVFQPAEESDGGALPMIEAGILENPKVDAAFACHLWGSVPEGNVHLRSGPMMAAPDTFRFSIHGKGGHGAMPNLAVDPIVLGAHAVTMIQTIVSRRINPLFPAVITIGSIHSGDAHNVIPETLEVTGTVRSFSEDMRQSIPFEMERILKGITESCGASYTFDYERKFPPLINDPKMTKAFENAFIKIVGKDNVNANATQSMGGEDFAFFSEAVPSAFAFIGIAKNEIEQVLHHNPLFQWDDKNLKVLAQGMAQTAIDFLEEA